MPCVFIITCHWGSVVVCCEAIVNSAILHTIMKLIAIINKHNIEKNVTVNAREFCLAEVY